MKPRCGCWVGSRDRPPACNAVSDALTKRLNWGSCTDTALHATWRRSGGDEGEDLRLGEEVTGQGAYVVEGDRVDAGDDLVDGEQLVVDQLALAQARHPGAG